MKLKAQDLPKRVKAMRISGGNRVPYKAHAHFVYCFLCVFTLSVPIVVET